MPKRLPNLPSILTGRKNLDDILAVFSKTAGELDTYIGQRSADADTHQAAIVASTSAKRDAVIDIERASRTKAKIADLVA